MTNGRLWLSVGSVAVGGLGVWFGLQTAARAAEATAPPGAQSAAKTSANSPAQPAARVQYNRDIRPILSDNCFACHGPDKSHRKAKLRLDERDSAIAREAIVPGKPDESELVTRVFTNDDDERMPPADSHKTLTEAQKQLLKRWVQEGAEYQPHWAYITPTKAPVPQVGQKDWVKNPIDAFILQALEEKQITPSREADRRTLLRRLSLDLIGLPPTPAEVEAFVNDKSPGAYDKQVERLLNSPHYGERMAAPWLDAVRFADTVGFHGDQNHNVFPYRDYLVNAFNANKPYNQFVIEQLAGDLLPVPTTEQLIATGFNRLNMVTREGGAQPKEYLAKYTADRVRTVGNAFLGSTFGCAECHDHKFDPITARDFYSLGAFFADVKQWGVYHDYGYTPNPDLRGWSNDHPFPPEIVVESPYLQRRLAKLNRQIDETIAAAKVDEARFNAWREKAAAFLASHPDGWAPAKPAGVEPWSPATNRTKDGTYDDAGAVLFVGKARNADKVEFDVEPGMVGALRIELLPHEAHRNNVGSGSGASVTFTMSAAIKSADGKTSPLPIHYADADVKDDRYASGYAILGIKDGWKTSSQHLKAKQTGVYVLDKPAEIKPGDKLVLTLPRNGVGCLRVATSPIGRLDPTEPNLAESLRSAVGGSSLPADQLALRRSFLLSNPSDPATVAKVRKLYREVLECRDGKSPTLVTQAWEPKVQRILPRGNWQDETGEVVQPAPPHFLPQSRGVEGRRLNRLDLANWIVSPENPLTARVFANRLWKQYFGNGLSNTIEDLGAQGEPPSHPELLDWLAVEFREKGWDVKHLVRLMVTSSTYRQDSNVRPDLKDVDPANRLLAYQNPRRLEAEFVRDNALFAAGLINLDLGGPSVKPYQPADYYENLQFPDRPYSPESDERQYRRGLYVHWQRTFVHPMLANFDAPSREDSLCTRTVSNTPQQALTLLNDPTFVEAARVLAQQVLSTTSSDDAQRIDAIYQRVLARAPRKNERESLKKFLAAQRELCKTTPDDVTKLLKVGQAPVPADLNPAELASWTNVCRVVLNLHESITRY